MLRRSPRALAWWAAAAVLALVTGTTVAGDLAALHRRARALGPEQEVVVARRDLALGSTITPGDVGTRRVHSSQVPRGALHDLDVAVGRVLRVPVVRDAYVHARHLAPRHRSGLAGALPEGTRAVRIVVEQGLRPEPGSAVDVYAAFASGTDVLGTGRAPAGPATLVAAGVVVLAADGDGATAGGAGTGFGVTLLVEPHQAADLAAASAHGSLFLALVPPEDARLPRAVTRR